MSQFTQKEAGGLYELTDAARADLAARSLQRRPGSNIRFAEDMDYI